MLLSFMALVVVAVRMVSAQTRNGGEVQNRGEPDTQSVIVTDKTRAFLSCENGDMVVKVNFTQPFRGVLYAHRSRTSPCRMHGTGQLYVELKIPLKGCGTWQESPRVFVNNITIRFHPALELEEDETKTVVCRYPPPLTPAPGTIQIVEPVTVLPTTIPTRVGKARLSELEILIIICLLLFLSLLTLGIGIAYFCLRRRNIRIVRKTHTSSSAPPSQITRLSSSNLQAPPSSLITSILGHTVRIPRAVPYSAPVQRTTSSEQAYEEYPASSSIAETSSAELSETSVSSSSLADDKVDSSRHLLYKKGGPRSILSIPKAILRRTGNRRWPSVHHSHSKARRSEREDQIVTTVLGSEVPQVDEDHYWKVDELEEEDAAGLHATEERSRVADSLKQSPIPVYAQVEKSKKVLSKEKVPVPAQTEIKSKTSTSVSFADAGPITAPVVSKTSEEVTKNTTVTTSVRREVKETVILATPDVAKSSTGVQANIEKISSAPTNTALPVKQTGDTTQQNIKKTSLPPKKILIRDVADVFLTTTVETESRELKTKTTKDIIQSKRRRQQDSPDLAPPPEPPKIESLPLELSKPSELLKPNQLVEAALPKATESAKPSLSTDGWNVVIRQRKLPSTQDKGTDLDSTDLSAEDPEERTKTEAPAKPQFDVKIRTIPPSELCPKNTEKLIVIPPLEMPQTISKLKEALMTDNKLELKSPTTVTDAKKTFLPKSPVKSSVPPRTVRWMDEPKESDGSMVSSSDSFQSAESLRERSSSEVLEVAPTLPNQRRDSIRSAMLERSSSEIETSPEDSQVRWIGGVVPVLEPSVAKFPSTVVTRAGFFDKKTEKHT